MKKFVVISSILLAICLVFLPGCVPQNYWRSQGRETKKAGEKLLREYLDSKYDKYELRDIEVETGAEEGEVYFKGAYLTKCVNAELVVGDETYEIYTDTETGRIYTEELEDEVKDFFYSEMEPYLIRHGFMGEYAIDRIFVPLTIVNHDVENRNKTVNTEIAIDGCFPVGTDTSDMNHYFENSENNHEVSAVWVAYYGDWEPTEEIYHELLADHAYMENMHLRFMKLSKEDVNKIKNGGWYNSDMELLEDVHYQPEKE